MFEITMERPRDQDELWKTLEAHRDGYSILAGGTDLVVQGRLGHHVDRVWVDITRIPELRTLEDRADHLWIGATATWTQIYRSPLVQQHMPAMLPCCFEVGSPQIRNLGTLGGNVANASPAGDSIPVLLIHDTRVVLRSRGGTRTMPLEEFLLGVRRTKLAAGEVIWGFEVPHGPAHAARFLKLGPRESLAISKVNAALKAHRQEGKLAGVRIAIGSAAPVVFRAREAEAALEGTWPDGAALESAAARARAQATTITDARSTAEYREAMVEVLVRRGMEEIMAELEGRG